MASSSIPSKNSPKPPHLKVIPLSDDHPLEASKWSDIGVLLHPEELSDLMEKVSPFWIYQVGAVLPLGEGGISASSFLESYQKYMDTLKQGDIPDDSFVRRLFSVVWTRQEDALYMVEVPDKRGIIKVGEPVVQLQAHRVSFSPLDGQMRSQVFGKETFWWGIFFSLPQLYVDKKTQEVKKVRQESVNGTLFQEIQSWVRHHTVPTSFLIDGVKKTFPLRLGKQLTSWINQHPQLKKLGLEVAI